MIVEPQSLTCIVSTAETPKHERSTREAWFGLSVSCFIGDMFHYSFWTATACYLPPDIFQCLADVGGQAMFIKQVFWKPEVAKWHTLTHTHKHTHTHRGDTRAPAWTVYYGGISEPRAARLWGNYILDTGAWQSLGEEIQGGVSLLHQLCRCGVHLGSGEVIDGKAIDHFPGLVLWIEREESVVELWDLLHFVQTQLQLSLSAKEHRCYTVIVTVRQTSTKTMWLTYSFGH